MVSSFFYFIYKGDEKYILKSPPVKIVLNPFKLYKYLTGRYVFSRYIKDFCINGNKNHGKWKDHVDSWSKFINEHKNIKSVIVSYENLINDTKGELINILRDLGFSNAERKTIIKTTIKESFSERKKNISYTKKELTFGKNYNLSFLRKGTPGDYKRFLNAKQINYIKSFLKGEL